MTTTTSTELVTPGPFIAHYDGLGFTVVATQEKYAAAYTVYPLAASLLKSDKTFVHPRQLVLADLQDPQLAIQLEKVVIIKGKVQWNGCSNWTFPDYTNNTFHACTRQQLVNLGAIMGKCFDMTAQLREKSLG